MTEKKDTPRPVALPLRLAAPHIAAKVMELVYTDESQVAVEMGPEGSPMLLFAYNMQKKMLGTALELLDHCQDERELTVVKRGLKAWCQKS